MSATPPEANTQYSSLRAFSRRAASSLSAPAPVPSEPVLAGTVLGAVVLIIAEFTPLYHVHVVTSLLPIKSVSVGSHNAYALIPIALLAVALGLVGRWRPSRSALVALIILGVVALLIALLGDFPDTHARGITHQTTLASTTAGIGLYLETLGALILVATGGLGLLAAGAPPRLRR